MNEYIQFKRRIQQRLDGLDETIRELEEFGFVEKSKTSRWREHLALVQSSLKDSLLRVAVVGSVKSGKSTLINALVSTDLLKMGAGIITAFITRIRTNEETGGWVDLKPWSQALKELNSAIRGLPILQEELGENEFVDLRQAEDRRKLRSWLDKMQTEWQQTTGRLDPNFVLLNSYLEGYERLHASLREDVNRLIFDARSLSEHQHYVGQEGQAVYVRDMELHHPIPWLGDKLEIADCQGSDSPNPLHFALLQQYLLKSHFILYVISSRTGLREADFKLLDFIKTLRMFPQTFFILNVDLDAHPDLEDLQRSVERVHTELSWIVPRPQLYAFSALYHLIDGMDDGLAERERRRFELWTEDPALARFSQTGFDAFREEIVQRVSNQRARVLLGTGLGRINTVAASVLDTARVQKRFMGQNLGTLKQSARQLKNNQKALQGTLGTLENAISGLKESLRKELDSAVSAYFDLTYGAVVRETMHMVDNYPVDPQYQKNLVDYRQLVRQLHRFYLEFKQSLARYLVEKVNLRVIEFAKEQEEFLEERLQHSSRAFWALFATALEDYRKELSRFEIDLRATGDRQDYDWSTLEKVPVPSFSGFVDEQTVGRGVLLMKFGLARVTSFLTGLKARIGRSKDFTQSESEENRAMEEAVNLVKSEAKSELIYSFRDYRQNFKFGYLYRLLDAGTHHLLEEFKVRAEMAQMDFVDLLKRGEIEGEARLETLEALDRISRDTEAMVEELEGLRCAVNLDWLPREEEVE